MLDFNATFAADGFQHVGFAKDFTAPPWAMFSTGGGALPVGLYARTSDGTTTRDTPILGVDPTQPHDYEIRWTSTSFDYYVDGTQVDSAPITIATPMSPQISDFNTGNPVTVDSMKLTTSPPTYRSSGTYTSPVFDGGSGFITGITLTPSATTPAGTTITYRDANWHHRHARLLVVGLAARRRGRHGRQPEPALPAVSRGPHDDRRVGDTHAQQRHRELRGRYAGPELLGDRRLGQRHNRRGDVHVGRCPGDVSVQPRRRPVRELHEPGDVLGPVGRYPHVRGARD